MWGIHHHPPLNHGSMAAGCYRLRGQTPPAFPHQALHGWGSLTLDAWREIAGFTAEFCGDKSPVPLVMIIPQTGLTVMGFLLPSKGCIPGPHDFASVSGLASHSGCLGPHEFTLVSPTCLPLCVPWAAWVYTCLPLVSHPGCLGPHEFTLVSPLSSTLGALGRMSLHLSPPCRPIWVPWAAWVYTCLPLVSALWVPVPHELTLVSPLSLILGALGRMSLHFSPPCVPHLSPTLVSHSGCLGPHEFTLVSSLSPPCLPLWVPWAAWVYTCLPLVSHTCLPQLSPTLVSHTCLPHLSPTLGSLGPMSLHLSSPCLPLWVPRAAWVCTCLPLVSHSGRLGPHEFTLVSTLVSHTCLPHLSPTLVSLGHMSLNLSPPCLPLWVPWAAWVCSPPFSHAGFLGPHEFTLVSPLSPTLVSHSGCLGPHDFTLVSHLSPTLVSQSGFLGPHEFTRVSPLSPTLGALGCMSLHLSPTLVSHTCLPLVSHSGFLGPHEFTLVSPLSPTLGALGRMSLHLSPACLPLWVPWAAWVYTCLLLVSHFGCLGPHEFTLVFPLSPTLGALGRMSLHLSPTCLPLVAHSSPTLVSHTCLPLWVPWAAWVYTCLPLVSNSECLGPHEFTLVSHLSSPILVSHCGFLGPHGCTLVSPLSPTLVSHSGCLGPHEFTLVSHLSPTCLPLFSHLSPTLGALGRMSLHLSPPCLPHLSPTTVSHTCLPLWVPWAAWVYTCLPLVSDLSALGRMCLHLFPTCLPHLSPTLVSHTCLPHLSPTLVSHSGFLGPHGFTLVSPLSPTLGALGRMSLHLSPPCLPHWVPWAAWVYTCLPLVSHTCLSLWVPWAAWVYTCLPLVSPSECLPTCLPHLSPTLVSLGRMSLHLSPPCLPLWVPWAAWVYTCLPLVPQTRVP